MKDNKESSAGQIVKNRDLTHYWWRDELVATKQQFFIDKRQNLGCVLLRKLETFKNVLKC